MCILGDFHEGHVPGQRLCHPCTTCICLPRAGLFHPDSVPSSSNFSSPLPSSPSSASDATPAGRRSSLDLAKVLAEHLPCLILGHPLNPGVIQVPKLSPTLLDSAQTRPRESTGWMKISQNTLWDGFFSEFLAPTALAFKSSLHAYVSINYLCITSQ